MELNREKLKRMFEDTKGNGGSANGGGGGGSLAGYATQAWVNEGFVSIEFFNRLFTVYGPGETSSDPDVVIEPNDLDSTIKNIKAMFGFWTEYYVSALGNGGDLGSTLYLSSLADVALTSPISDGQVLQYNLSTGKWTNATLNLGSLTLSGLSDVLLSTPSANQVLLYDGITSKWTNSDLKTINGIPIYGSGDIAVGGGASGNYLPLAGGSMTGAKPINFMEDRIAINMRPNNSSYYSKIEYMTNGNEALVFANKKSIQSFIFTCGVDLTNSSDWTTLSPAVQIRDSSLYVNTLLVNTTPTYNFQVTGTGNITTSLKVGSINIENGNEINHDSILCLNYNNSHIFACSGTGKMLIGGPWTIPSAKLHVNGNSYFTGGTKFTNICIECDNNIANNSARANEINCYNGKLFIQHNTSYATILCTGGGNVGIGASNPHYKLHVDGTIYATGAVTALSDARKKDVLGDAKIGVEQIADAPAVQFLWKGERAKEGVQVGTLAQYWQGVLPEVVMDKGGELSMQYGVAALVSAIITARKVVDHERRISELESRLKIEN